ncbi:unnamed protein product [Ixodes pacificus]
MVCPVGYSNFVRCDVYTNLRHDDLAKKPDSCKKHGIVPVDGNDCIALRGNRVSSIRSRRSRTYERFPRVCSMAIPPLPPWRMHEVMFHRNVSARNKIEKIK